jgi:carbonic anhydrase/acetyltransferase-like protein (isoleucine patch superfamily)
LSATNNIRYVFNIFSTAAKEKLMMNAKVIPLKGKTPTWGNDCFLADGAILVGEVVMGDHCSVWFNAVLRGDVNSITIGHHTNVQDGAIIHGTYQKAKTTIGNYVSIAHNAIIHGCTIEDEVLIGMGAIVMDNAVVKKGAIIAAGSIVLANTIVGEGELYAGIPAVKIKELSEEAKAGVVRTTNNYLMYAKWYE